MTSVVELSPRSEEADRRAIGQADFHRYERYLGEILSALGMDLATPGTRDTPARLLQALVDATAGYDGDPKLRTAFPSERPPGVSGTRSQIIEGPIAFHALCEHHALPFHGVAHVALRRRPGDPRDLEADPARAPLRSALHRAGAARRADRRHAGRARPAARRRRAPAGGAPLHPDARRLRARLADRDDVLARPVRAGSRAASRVPRRGSEPQLRPLQLLDEQPGLPEFDLPEELRELYGGGLGFRTPCLVANFVQTIDGVVAIPDLPAGNALIADGSEADRFVLGLLRACADVVLVASGTMLASPAGTWRPERVYPPAAAELRRAPPPPAAARTTDPRLSSPRAHLRPDPPGPPGERDRSHHRRRSRRVCGRECPSATEVVATNGGDSVDLELGLRALRERGHSLIVSEGGPTLFGTLVGADLVDELFLTISPLLAGRARKGGWRSWRESSCSPTWYTNRASSRCGGRQTISSSATHCVKSGQDPILREAVVVLFRHGALPDRDHLARSLVIYWAIRRADAEPTDEPPTRRWSKQPTPPRRGPNRWAPHGSGGRRRYERSA